MFTCLFQSPDFFVCQNQGFARERRKRKEVIMVYVINRFGCQFENDLDNLMTCYFISSSFVFSST